MTPFPRGEGWRGCPAWSSRGRLERSYRGSPELLKPICAPSGHRHTHTSSACPLSLEVLRECRMVDSEGRTEEKQGWGKGRRDVRADEQADEIHRGGGRCASKSFGDMKEISCMFFWLWVGVPGSQKLWHLLFMNHVRGRGWGSRRPGAFLNVPSDPREEKTGG